MAPVVEVCYVADTPSALKWGDGGSGRVCIVFGSKVFFRNSSLRQLLFALLEAVIT